MKRSHRRLHRWLWALLAPLLALLLALAGWSRVPMPVEVEVASALVNTLVDSR
jgi:hypothetical protein